MLGAVAGAALAYFTGGTSLAAMAGAAASGATVGSAVIDQPEAQKKAADAQAKSSEQAVAVATKQADQADQANNRANAKQPNVTSLDSANAASAKGGVSGTMLTGASGVDPKTLLLGKQTLLGA